MDCEKVRDHFSSLLEGDLTATEEGVVREHLATCPECQKEWEGFQKVLHWLHSADPLEVSEGFLSGVLEKMDERKRKDLMSQKPWWKWFDKALSLKLPIQAVAMVVILFLAFYIVKMMPVEAPRMKPAEPVKSLSSEERRLEAEQSQRSVKKEKVEGQPPLEAAHLNAEQAKKAPLEGKGVEVQPVQRGLKEERIAPQPLPGMSQPREIEKTESPRFGAEKTDRVLAAKKELSLASKPPREITITVFDKERALSRLYASVEQYGGEMVRAEGNIFLASLPIQTFPEFEKELSRLSSLEKASGIAPQKNGDLSLSAEAKKRKSWEGSPLAKPMPESEDRVVVRIVLIQE